MFFHFPCALIRSYFDHSSELLLVQNSLEPLLKICNFVVVAVVSNNVLTNNLQLFYCFIIHNILNNYLNLQIIVLQLLFFVCSTTSAENWLWIAWQIGSLSATICLGFYYKDCGCRSSYTLANLWLPTIATHNCKMRQGHQCKLVYDQHTKWYKR